MPSKDPKPRRRWQGSALAIQPRYEATHAESREWKRILAATGNYRFRIHSGEVIPVPDDDATNQNSDSYMKLTWRSEVRRINADAEEMFSALARWAEHYWKSRFDIDDAPSDVERRTGLQAVLKQTRSARQSIEVLDRASRDEVPECSDVRTMLENFELHLGASLGCLTVKRGRPKKSAVKAAIHDLANIWNAHGVPSPKKRRSGEMEFPSALISHPQSFDPKDAVADRDFGLFVRFIQRCFSAVADRDRLLACRLVKTLYKSAEDCARSVLQAGESGPTSLPTRAALRVASQHLAALERAIAAFEDRRGEIILLRREPPGEDAIAGYVARLPRALRYPGEE